MPNRLKLDEVREAIIRVCETNYRLADDECGYSLIRKEDVKEEAEGIFVVRFRLPLDKRNALASLANFACKNVFKCVMNLFIDERTDYGIPYLECAWLINGGEPSHESDVVN